MALLVQILAGTFWFLKRIPSAIFVFGPASWISRV